MSETRKCWTYQVNNCTVTVALIDYAFTFSIVDVNGKRVRAGGNYAWDEFQSAVFDTCIKPTEVETTVKVKSV